MNSTITSLSPASASSSTSPWIVSTSRIFELVPLFHLPWQEKKEHAHHAHDAWTTRVCSCLHAAALLPGPHHLDGFDLSDGGDRMTPVSSVAARTATTLHPRHAAVRGLRVARRFACAAAVVLLSAHAAAMSIHAVCAKAPPASGACGAHRAL
jgi:hypothetical protein